MQISVRKLGPFAVSAIGFGCMNMSHGYGEPPPAVHNARILNEALDLGYTMLDTAALYGFGLNEEMIAKAIRHRRDEYILASKCGLHGVAGKRERTNDPAKLRQSCEDSLKRLRTEAIDLFYLHRYVSETPLEDSIGVLADLVREGKVRAIGLSEVSAETLRRAHAIHPIAAVQTEYSLWTREPEIAVLDSCSELGVAFVAFSPLARGFLTGRLRDVSKLGAKDLRRNMPRFYAENYARNLELLDQLVPLAQQHECTLGQLALAWLLKAGSHIIPIPGTTNSEHLRENFAAQTVELTPAEFDSISNVINTQTVFGDRYVAATQAEIDTEQFPPT